MEYFEMNNGVRMPMAGIGVFTFTPEEAEASVASALKDGVRLVDTANAYMNERGTARGIEKSGVSRDEVFLVTKLWPSVYEKETAVDETLARLNTDHIDLLFLHQPTRNWKAGYRQIEKAVKEGKVRAIGLSNFSIETLKEVFEFAEIQPQMVQVEAHPYYQQKELKDLLAAHGMGLMAWFPLGHGDKNLIQEPLFAQLGTKYGKSNAQIILRWHIQAGNIVIPGSRNPLHIRENFDIFDFELTEEEMEQIAALNKDTRYYQGSDELLDRYLAMAMDFDAQE